MENNCFIGIDVSKNKLDICVLQGKEVLQEDVIDNNPSAIQRFLVDMAEKRGLDLCSCLVCAEHTGNYTYPLTLACRDLGCRLWLGKSRPVEVLVGSSSWQERPCRRPADSVVRFSIQ